MGLSDSFSLTHDICSIFLQPNKYLRSHTVWWTKFHFLVLTQHVIFMDCINFPLKFNLIILRINLFEIFHFTLKSGFLSVVDGNEHALGKQIKQVFFCYFDWFWTKFHLFCDNFLARIFLYQSEYFRSQRKIRFVWSFFICTLGDKFDYLTWEQRDMNFLFEGRGW